MSALPVVTVASGGLPVISVGVTPPKATLAVTVAANGRGIPVTVVTLPTPGLPVSFVP